MDYFKVEHSASRGIAMAPVFQYAHPDLTPSTEPALAEEVGRYELAKAQVLADLTLLAQTSEIFMAHLEMADDFTFHEGVTSKIQAQQCNAQQAVSQTVSEIEAMFSMIDDPYMQARAADVKDVGKRYMAALKGVTLPDLGNLTAPVVVVAQDLYPSDTVKLDKTFVKGILTQEGGVTSHVFIIAKAMGIPILVGVPQILDKTRNGQMVCFDGATGDLYLDPTPEILDTFTAQQTAFASQAQQLEALRHMVPTTPDGKEIFLCANVGSVAEIQAALACNIHGVGLFRSELLYMENTHFPTEEEQFQVYSQAAKLCPKEVTIRTLDIGGDKSLPYFQFDQEENPFLGWRAVRICLEMEAVFKDQIRAILRASAFGNVRMMVPMLISLQELTQVKALVERCKLELDTKGLAYNPNMPLGMMVETPASVILAHEFAKEVDFFSIGTNDLTQYLLAVDRGNPKIAHLYDYCNPAVVEAIRSVIQAGHLAGIPVGMCGEMAGDPKVSAMLLAMGLDEFSMSASSVDYVRQELLHAVEKKGE